MGWHTLTVHYDGISESVEVYLDFLGDYTEWTGTPESVKGLGWIVTEWHPVQ